MAKKMDPSTKWESDLRAIGIAIRHLERLANVQVPGEVVVYDVRFKLDADNGTSVLAIVKGRRDDEKLISFVGGLDLGTVVMAVGKKIAHGGLSWRIDVPWKG